MKNNDRIIRPVASILVLVLIVCVWVGEVVRAKYIYENSFNGTVTLYADLGKISVKEHLAQRQQDGTYQLMTETVVQGNQYLLMPGVDVPKDPWVSVSAKTVLPAYVFLKVDTNLPADSGVTYKLSSNWMQIEDSAYYVYAPSGGVPAQVTANVDIPVLDTISADNLNHLQVSQELNISGACYLNFIPAMGEIQLGYSLAAVKAAFGDI